MRPFMLYHWSPVSNRKGILKRGLVPGMRKCNSGTEWKSPYICFAKFPTAAWALSATHCKHIPEWDLWCCWSDCAQFRAINYNGSWYLVEYRTEQRIPKSKLWHVGTRVNKKRKELTW